MKELTEDLDVLVRSTPILLLQFGEDTCGPCHAIRFKLDRWMEKHDEITARYVDIGKHLVVCSQNAIFSAPTVIVYMDGQMIVKESGYFSLDAILDRIEHYLKLR